MLSVEHLDASIGRLAILHDVSLEVAPGEVVGVLGPNGAGKSTLLKAIGGMQSASAGSVVFDGVDITHYPSHRARHAGVAMVLQTPRPFGTMTVRENIALGALFGGERLDQPAALRRADEMLAFVGLADRGGELATSLNLHEQRLLEIARQLAGGPRLVLLDEVMAGLNDTELASSIDMVRRARAELGVTVLWVEHVMQAVMSLAERVLVLNFGRLIADGAPQVVMRQPDVVTAYLGEQGVA
jgi:branched-chain amino acid transport system ATP-binding protein